jgi:signal recognition particle receptor subunit beta
VASINYATREISCKIVYYGPGLSGKTTNLQIIHRKIPDKDKSEMVSLATETDRTLFFDFLPLDLGSIKGFSTKFQLYTVPGQVYYNATRKLVLRGVDGVVFVVDSQVDKLQENLESFANLQENLREYGHSIENIPLVLQYNKRDLPNVYPIEQLNSLINKHKLPHYEAVAATGVGVFTTLKAIGKSVIDKFNAKYAGFQGTRRPARPGEAPAASAPAAPKPAAPQAPAAPARTAPPSFGGGYSNNPSTPAIPPRPADGSRAPLNVPGTSGGFNAPAPGGFSAPSAPSFGAPAQGFGSSAPPNPFSSAPSGLPTSAGFPGQGSHPAPVTGPAPTGGFGGPAGQGPVGQGPGGFGAPPAPGGFSMGAPNPFASTPGQNPGGPAFGAPGAPRPAFPGALPSFPTGSQTPGGGGQPGQGGFPFAGNKPGGPGGPAGQGPGIPVSPFVESFGKPGGSSVIPPNPPAGIPGMNPPLQNPFSGGGAPPAFGQNKPASPGGPGIPIGGGFPSFPGPAGNPPGPQNPQGGFGGPGPSFGAPSQGFNSPGAGSPGYGGFGGPASGGFGGAQAPGPFGSPPSGFGASAPGGFGAPSSGGFGSQNPMGQPGPAGPGPGAAFQPPPGKGGPPYPTLQPPAPPEEPPQNRTPGGLVDNSGIVTTYEDMAKDDSFKTKKLPHPSEKKKGFFDGLFKKDK